MTDSRHACGKVRDGAIRTGSLPVSSFEDRIRAGQDVKVPGCMHLGTGYPSRPPAGRMDG